MDGNRDKTEEILGRPGLDGLDKLWYNSNSHGFARELCYAKFPREVSTLLQELKTREKVVGLKQSLRAAESGRAGRVFLARDADPALLDGLRRVCGERDVPVEDAFGMKELGAACGLSVGAAAAALLR